MAKVRKKLWNDIPGFTRYQVTRTGRVRSKSYNHTGKAKEMSPNLDRDGYKQIQIYNDQRELKMKKVHQLIAMTFIRNPLNKPQVNHKDSIRTNNNAKNLEWCTISENAIHGFNQGSRRSPFVGMRFVGKNNGKSKPVIQFSLEGKKLNEFESANLAIILTKSAKVVEVCNGDRKTSGGFKWAYKKVPVKSELIKVRSGKFVSRYSISI